MYIYTANIDLYLFFICFKQYLYTSQTLKNQKNKKENHKLIKKNHSFLKIKIYIHTLQTS